MLKTNTKAPDFKLPSTSKDKYSLKDSIGKYVVIYFYPKDDTPGCTIETNDFNKLLTKNQKIIIEIDKNYIQKFVKISIYLKTKKSNTQKIFDSIKDTKNDTELNELVNLLKNQIHTYELENGSLLLMKGKTQKYWEHEIPKTKKNVSGRINLTFRYII